MGGEVLEPTPLDTEGIKLLIIKEACLAEALGMGSSSTPETQGWGGSFLPIKEDFPEQEAPT